MNHAQLIEELRRHKELGYPLMPESVDWLITLVAADLVTIEIIMKGEK